MDLSSAISKVTSSSSEAAQGIDKTLDINVITNPEEMLKNQFRFIQYANFLTYGSTMLKVYKDLVGGIIAKI